MKRFTSTAIAAAVLISSGQAHAKAQASAPPMPQAQPQAPAKTPDSGQSAMVDESLAGQRYVAIGSSFAAGPMLPPAKSGAPARCGQSMNNYPTLLAERFGMILTDRTCSGATTNNVLGPWGEIAPQINAVTPQTRLVTVTIGGNDLNYIGNLFTATCLYRASQLPPGSKRAACGAVKVPTEVDYARDEMQMMEIARRIRTVAPRTRLVFVQYLTPLPQPGSLCAATPVSEEHAATTRRIGQRLSEITARVAQAYNAIVVEMNQTSAAHTPCDTLPWMIGSPEGYDGSQGLQWHLNFAGMQATANDIAWSLTRSGVKAPTPTLTLLPQTVQTPAPVIAPPPPRPAAATSRPNASKGASTSRPKR
ncbi:SGNH/GDSL hydrolase family protein [Novosphingobium sp.]|uniref:SGNH/GDSL hydrolase family protein n=1 Tax=Novosphingobium sp. TaxID=1874826 RepID=UPI0028A6755D|nr:SGNH/GDSL hydrolase family protein [Novosphingobium sp.]